MERWNDKVAIVTGASAGIGAAIAQRLVRDGLKVAGFARRKERIEELSKNLQGEKGQLHAIKVDITNENEIVEAFKWVKKNLGPVHILVNNAGIIKNNFLIDGDYQKWKEVIDTNVLGLCVCTSEAVRDMRANDIAGHIIHINSIGGHKVVRVEEGLSFNVYSASKFAVTALTETLRQELNSNKLKIKVTSISPGVVLTDGFKTSGFVEAKGDNKDMPKTPFLKSEDIAEAVRYTLSTPPHVQVHELIIKPVGEEF